MNKLKKVLPYVALPLIGMTSNVKAVDDMQVRNLENRVNALEQRRGANGMINPTTRPVVKDGADLWFQAEALYMHATEDNIDYCLKTSASSTGYVDGRVKNISYDWSWGWRAGLGYNLPHDGWDVILNYNWFRSNTRNSTHANSTQTIAQTWTNASSPVASALVTHGLGKSYLKFDYLDTQIGREFFISKWLVLRPFAGVRGLWAHRDLKVTYEGGSLGSGNLANVGKIREKFNNRFRGAGLLTGLDTQWGFGMGWSLYGDVGVALIYGNQRLHETQDQIAPDTTSTRFTHAHVAWKTVRTMVDLAFGLRWDHLLNDDAYRVRLQLGWEQHLLPGFGKEMNFVNNSVQGKIAYAQGDLAISGLALQARFDF